MVTGCIYCIFPGRGVEVGRGADWMNPALFKMLYPSWDKGLCLGGGYGSKL